MLSRVADNLYWFCRYVRRAENTARLVGVGSVLQLDLPRSARFTWRPLVETTGEGDLFESCHPAGEEPVHDTDVLKFLLLDERNPSALRSSVGQARELLRGIRDTLPREVWEAVNALHLYIDANGERALSRRYRMDFLLRVTDGCLKVSGLLVANVSHDIGFQFMRLGTALEQADMTTRIADAGASGLIAARHEEDQPAFRSMQWLAVLRALAADQMFRRHARQRVNAEHALRFLLQNREFPRSVQFCLTRIQRALPGMPPRPGVERALNRVLGLVAQADPAALAVRDPTPFLDEAQVYINRLHEAISVGYFSG